MDVEKAQTQVNSGDDKFEFVTYRILTGSEIKGSDLGGLIFEIIDDLGISEADALPIPNRRARLRRSSLLTVK